MDWDGWIFLVEPESTRPANWFIGRGFRYVDLLNIKLGEFHGLPDDCADCSDFSWEYNASLQNFDTTGCARGV